MRILFVTLLCASVMFTRGQQVLTIDQAIAQTLKTNYDILLVTNEAESWKVDQQFADAVFLPQLSATAGKLWNDNTQQSDFQDGRKRQGEVKSSNINAAVNLNWTLFDGLRMFATRKRVAELKTYGELNVRNQVVNAVASVISNYYNIVRQKQQLRAIDTLIAINEERVQLADRKLLVGLGSKPELLQAKVDLNAQKASRMLQETLLDQLRQQLNQLMGIDIQAVYEVADSIPIRLDIRYDSIATGVEQTNPALLASRKTIEVAELALRERRAELFPTIQLNSAYNFGRTANGSVVNPEFQPIFNLNKGFSYGFSASIPFLNGFNTRRQIRQAGLDLEYNRIAYSAQRSQVDLGIRNSYKDYEYQVSALQLEEENISLARENVFIALERFRQGVSTYLELREAQISLEAAYNRLIAARYNTKLAETELLRLKGSVHPAAQP